SLNIGGRFTVEPSHLFPARVIDLWPRDDSPSVFIASVSGQAMPDDPLANIEIGSMADLSLQAVTNEGLVATTYFTTNALVNLRIVARSGRTDAVQTMQYLSSDPVNTNRLFWKANVAFRPGYHVLQAHVLSP
ncbi:MAG TPA: hypothetical protein PKE47_17330, partial [Verrucomicrobiota bacterium]|nr:hypothetical protein [Verrucomicrobiota bacterium]